MDYIGRFAPSPSGPLHFGSLVAALASYLDARSQQGTWLLRIEDLDPPRESPTAPQEIISQLKAFGLNWDGDILFQSTRLDAYQTAMTQLQLEQRTYHCTCSRKSLPTVYPGICRAQKKPLEHGGNTAAIRLKLPDETLAIDDGHLGLVEWRLKQEVGDFIIKRKDGLFAYQLAVVVDDIYQGVTNVVRGIDLLDSTPRQLALYQQLHKEPPEYLHIPIVVDHEEVKLSKQTRARPVATTDALSTVRCALSILGQKTHDNIDIVGDLLVQAADNWDTSLLPERNRVTVPDAYR